MDRWGFIKLFFFVFMFDIIYNKKFLKCRQDQSFVELVFEWIENLGSSI